MAEAVEVDRWRREGRESLVSDLEAAMRRVVLRFEQHPLVFTSERDIAMNLYHELVTIRPSLLDVPPASAVPSGLRTASIHGEWGQPRRKADIVIADPSLPSPSDKYPHVPYFLNAPMDAMIEVKGPWNPQGLVDDVEKLNADAPPRTRGLIPTRVAFALLDRRPQHIAKAARAWETARSVAAAEPFPVWVFTNFDVIPPDLAGEGLSRALDQVQR